MSARLLRQLLPPAGGALAAFNRDIDVSRAEMGGRPLGIFSALPGVFLKKRFEIGGEVVERFC